MNRSGKFKCSSWLATLVVITLLSGCSLSNQDILIMQEDLSKIKRQLTSLEDTVTRKLPASSATQPKAEQNLLQEVKVTQKNQADAKIKLDEVGDNVQMVRSKMDELNYQMNGINQKIDNLDMRLSGQGPRSSGASGIGPTGMITPPPEQSSQNVPSIGALGSQQGVSTQPLAGSSSGAQDVGSGQAPGGPFKSGQLQPMGPGQQPGQEQQTQGQELPPSIQGE